MKERIIFFMNTTELDRLQFMSIRTNAKIKVYGRQLPPDDKQCKVYGNILAGEVIVVSKNLVNILGQSAYILSVPVAVAERSPFFIRETDVKSKCEIIEEELQNIPVAYVVDSMETITTENVSASIAAMDRVQFVTIPKGTKISTRMIYNKYALAEIDGAPIGFVLKSVFGIEIKQDELIVEESDSMKESIIPQVSDTIENTADQGKQKYLDDIVMTDEIIDDEVLFLDLIVCHIDTGRKREKFIQVMNKLQDTDLSYHSMVCPSDEEEFVKLQETMKHYNMHSVLDNIPLDYFNNAYILVDGTNTVRLKKKMLSLGLKPIIVR